MERVAKYEEIIIKELERYASNWNKNEDNIRTQTIIDPKGNHYQLIRLGWRNEDDYVHYCVFHIDIIDGKVWIQENQTDILIAEQLVELGIDKQDIVLGVLPPQLRKDSEYAAA